MKQIVECVDNGDNVYSLTIGRYYNVDFKDMHNYHIVNDKFVLCSYPHSYFEVVEGEIAYNNDEKSIIKYALETILVEVEERIQSYISRKRYNEGIKPMEYASKIKVLLEKYQ